MAAINHNVTEQELHEVYLAIKAIQCQKGHTDKEAKETAQLLSYAVFRNLITFESLISSIIQNSKQAFNQ